MAPRAPQLAEWQYQPCVASTPTLHDGCVSSCHGAGQRTSPPRGTVIPASRWKYSGGGIRLYGSRCAAERLARGRTGGGAGSVRSPISSSIR